MSSHRYHTVVKRYHVRRREIQLVVAILATAVLLTVGFYLGQRSAYGELGADPEAYLRMTTAAPVSVQEFEQMRGDLDMGRTRNEVDRAAMEMVRSEIASQKEQILILEESLRFYQGLMAPEDIAKGLTIRPIELIATESDKRFRFRIVAQQEARKHSLLKGSLSVKVLGMVGSEEREIPLSDLSEDLEEPVVLRFRYFQAIEGELVLPEGFRPLSVAVVAATSAPKKVEVHEKFPWSLQERFSYVGK